MIHYQLQCGQGHGFDGWFRDSAAFDAQAAAGLVVCPTCADTAIRRAMMAPAVAKGREPALPAKAAPAPEAAPDAASAQPPAMAGSRLPDHLRALLQRLRAEVERNCDYVGPQFAEEARRIHNGESDRRGIYGEASSEEAAALAEEGIDVARIPWLPRAES